MQVFVKKINASIFNKNQIIAKKNAKKRSQHQKRYYNYL